MVVNFQPRYTDFYITTKTIHELFKDLDAEKMLEGEIESVAELQSKSRKVPTWSHFWCGVDIVGSQVQEGPGPMHLGTAALRGIQPSDKYYLIGIEKATK